MTGLDLGFAKIKEIFGTAAAIRENITTEEDAKLQIITRVLIEALGWDHKDISAERKNTNGFSDYIVSDLNSTGICSRGEEKWPHTDRYTGYQAARVQDFWPSA